PRRLLRAIPADQSEVVFVLVNMKPLDRLARWIQIDQGIPVNALSRSGHGGLEHLHLHLQPPLALCLHIPSRQPCLGHPNRAISNRTADVADLFIPPMPPTRLVPARFTVPP